MTICNITGMAHFKVLIRHHYCLLLLVDQILVTYGADLASSVKLTVTLWIYPYTVKNNIHVGE